MAVESIARTPRRVKESAALRRRHRAGSAHRAISPGRTKPRSSRTRALLRERIRCAAPALRRAAPRSRRRSASIRASAPRAARRADAARSRCPRRGSNAARSRRPRQTSAARSARAATRFPHRGGAPTLSSPHASGRQRLLGVSLGAARPVDHAPDAAPRRRASPSLAGRRSARGSRPSRSISNDLGIAEGLVGAATPACRVEQRSGTSSPRRSRNCLTSCGVRVDRDRDAARSRCPSSARWRRSIAGISSSQGLHQVAQKFSSTTLAAQRRERDRRAAVERGSSKAGAGCPVDRRRRVGPREAARERAATTPASRRAPAADRRASRLNRTTASSPSCAATPCAPWLRVGAGLARASCSRGLRRRPAALLALAAFAGARRGLPPGLLRGRPSLRLVAIDELDDRDRRGVAVARARA